MKTVYVQPKAEMFELRVENHMLAGSGNGTGDTENPARDIMLEDDY